MHHTLTPFMEGEEGSAAAPGPADRRARARERERLRRASMTGTHRPPAPAAAAGAQLDGKAKSRVGGQPAERGSAGGGGGCAMAQWGVCVHVRPRAPAAAHGAHAAAGCAFVCWCRCAGQPHEVPPLWPLELIHYLMVSFLYLLWPLLHAAHLSSIS